MEAVGVWGVMEKEDMVVKEVGAVEGATGLEAPEEAGRAAAMARAAAPRRPRG